MRDKILKVVGFALLAVSLSYGLAHANCGNDNGNGNGCSGDTGVQGPTGPQGLPGTNGINGTNGTDGKTGLNGVQGVAGPSRIDPRMNEAKFGIDTAVRLYDGKRVQVQAYNVYSPSTHDREDVIGDGRNLQYGVRIVFKLGRSWEEELIDKQAKQLVALEAVVSRLSQ